MHILFVSCLFGILVVSRFRHSTPGLVAEANTCSYATLVVALPKLLATSKFREFMSPAKIFFKKYGII